MKDYEIGTAYRIPGEGGKYDWLQLEDAKTLGHLDIGSELTLK